MDGFFQFISNSLASPLKMRSLRRLITEDEIPNPVYEVEDAPEDRIDVSTTNHEGAWCDGLQCNDPETKRGKVISSLRYCCIDCPVGKTDFCSTCVKLPGQGINHDITHRLVQIAATICAVCQGMAPLKVQQGDMFRGPYSEISATTATFQRIKKQESCVFCAFYWSALSQCPPTQPWPLADDEVVKIRVRRPWRNCCRISVVSPPPPAEDYEIKGAKYSRRTENVQDGEKDLEVYVQLGNYAP